MPKRLKTLFMHRHQFFEKNTDTIFKAIANVTSGIAEYLNLKDEIAQGQLTWTNVVNHEKEGLVIMIGLIKYPPGAEFKTAEGQMITISENTVDYFTRIIRFTMPYDLVDKGTSEEVLAFLKSLEQESQQQTEMVQIPAEAMSLAEFEFDELTEEQKAAMVIDYQDKSVH